MAFNEQGIFIGDLSAKTGLTSESSFQKRLKFHDILHLKGAFGKAHWRTIVRFAQCAGHDVNAVSGGDLLKELGWNLFPQWLNDNQWDTYGPE